jgi:hypothetical protein
MYNPVKPEIKRISATTAIGIIWFVIGLPAVFYLLYNKG